MILVYDLRSKNLTRFQSDGRPRRSNPCERRGRATVETIRIGAKRNPPPDQYLRDLRRISLVSTSEVLADVPASLSLRDSGEIERPAALPQFLPRQFNRDYRRHSNEWWAANATARMPAASQSSRDRL